MWAYDAQVFCAILSAMGINPSDGPALEIGGSTIATLPDGGPRNPMLDLMPQVRFLDLGFLGGLRGQDIQGDFLDPNVVIPLQDAFRFTCSFTTLEHVGNPFKFARHMALVTQPGGYIWLTSVFSFPYHPSPEDYWRFSPKGLKVLFDDLPVNVSWYGWNDMHPEGVHLFAQKRPSPLAPRHYHFTKDYVESLRRGQ